MNLTEAQLRNQFDRVVAEGWIAHLSGAAAIHFPGGEFDASLLFALGSRETNWNARYLREPGDNGNGFGPMQIDRRSFPEWVASGAWRDPGAAILKGAEVLRSKLDDTIAMQGKPITMKSGGQSYTVTAAILEPELQRRVAIAAYNCGRWSLYHVSKGRDPDHGTTGKDYSADVLDRAEAARLWTPTKTEADCPTCHGTGRVSADAWSKTWGNP